MDYENWYEVTNAAQIDSPCFLIYPERVRENIGRLKAMIDDPARLRPHVKTHKMDKITAMVMEEGINKFKFATIAEGEMLGRCGAADALMAYQPVGPKLLRFIHLIRQFPDTRYACLVDNARSASAISAAAADAGLVIDVYMDLDVGMGRTGIRPGEAAVSLFETCAALDGIHMKGFHVYDGHIHTTDLATREEICEKGYAPVTRLLEELEKRGFTGLNVVAGGSPSFPVHAKRKNVECSPGTFVFWDKGYQDCCPEQDFLPAGLVLARVVSVMENNRIAIDLGYKSIASENALDYRVFFINAPQFKFISHSEEHIVVEDPTGKAWYPGDLLYGLPVHVCPTLALYENAVIVENGRAVDTWEVTARDRKLTI